MFTEVQGKAVCLVYFAQVAVLKNYNLHHHYVTKHKEKYFSDKKRATESSVLLAMLQTQTLFTKHFYNDAKVIHGIQKFCHMSQDR